ncbi:hypothetical protein [Nocardia wallacei]|uniref:hypothetical protein n=1 Tax=Nocardia wallacei TaxID=480035 RepID=UPI0024563281|nr:hypothetical protein [Nocardia wallacei]
MTTSTATSAPGTGSGARLGNGELRRMVARVLADNPGTDYSPRDIAKLTGRSSGAIGNALKKLTDAGQAEQTGAKPLRYRANAATDAAAAGAPAPAPAAPAPKPAPPPHAPPPTPPPPPPRPGCNVTPPGRLAIKRRDL